MNREKRWFDSALGTTEFFEATYSDHKFHPHVHETFAIGIIESGGQKFSSEGNVSLVMPHGTLCVINPGVIHEGRPATEDGWRYRMVYPELNAVSQLLEVEVSDVPFFNEHVIDDAELFAAFHRLHKLSELKTELLEREQNAYYFFAKFFGRHASSGVSGKQEMKSEGRIATLVRDYIEAHCSEDISIKKISKICDRSETHVIRSFTKSMGMSPHKFLIALRVERAKALFRTAMTPTHVAHEVGFYDQSQLNRHFKKIVGTTPGSYRRLTSA